MALYRADIWTLRKLYQENLKEILSLVDRATLYNLVNKANLVHN